MPWPKISVLLFVKYALFSPMKFNKIEKSNASIHVKLKRIHYVKTKSQN